MAIPKKGSRLISVDNVKYRWLIRKKATYGQVDYGIGFLHVAVDLEEKQGTALIIFTNHRHPNDIEIKEIITVIPSIISSWILNAIDLGWQPNIPGSQFLVKIDKKDVMTKL